MENLNKHNKSMKIMGHMVIGYPSLSRSYEIAKIYIKNGIDILELQIPFSHPTADGPIITLANKTAIKNKTSWKDCFNFLDQLRKEFPSQLIYLMTYTNKLISLDFNILFLNLKKLKINELIIPDLPFDSPEYNNIEKSSNIKLIPVININISEYRLNKLLEKKPKFIYLMSGFKITGTNFKLHKKIKSFIKEIKLKHNTLIGIGFGIDSYNDVLSVKYSNADILIIGSSLIKAEQEGKLKQKIFEIQGKHNNLI